MGSYAIKSVSIKNFRGYGENEKSENKYFEFDNLDSDIVLLSGHNGYGKTSFFEAIEWCLTDNIDRLKKLTALYGVQKLKNKHYLKYYSPTDDYIKRYNREVDVKITFSNNVVIRRTTKEATLKLSEAHDYESRLFINGEEIPYDDKNEKHKKALAKKLLGNDNQFLIDNIIKSNFLGQENINGFLRTNRPQDRKTTLLKLLSYDDIEDIFQNATKLKNSRKLSSARNKHEENKDKYLTYKSRIAEKFSNINNISITNYLNTINKNTIEIISKVTSNDLLKAD